MSKINTVNVVEYFDKNILSIRSFPDNEKGNKDAEKLFSNILKEHGIYNEWYYFIENGQYSDDNGFELFLIHSI